jgi:hypothetical protein
MTKFLLACLLCFVFFDVPISVHSVSVSQNEIVFCPSSNESCSKDSILEVQTKATDSGDGKVYYLYKVSAGKIIGSGAFVKWDLTGIAPGTYTITAAVHTGDKKVYGATKTEVVKVIK